MPRSGTAPRLVVGAVIVDDLEHPTRVLGARRLGGAPSVVGRWEFPGGKVDPGETPQEALLRELREELGFDARLGDEIVNPDGSTWPIAPHLRMRLWFAVAEAGEPVLGDVHSEIRWVERDRLDELDWLDADLAVLPHLFAS